MALIDSIDPKVMEKFVGDCRKEFENMVHTLITVQPMSGSIFGEAWRGPHGFSAGVEQPLKMKVLKNRNGRVYSNPCDEITLGQPQLCSLPYELEEDTPEQAYERAMQGI